MAFSVAQQINFYIIGELCAVCDKTERLDLVGRDVVSHELINVAELSIGHFFPRVGDNEIDGN